VFNTRAAMREWSCSAAAGSPCRKTKRYASSVRRPAITIPNDQGKLTGSGTTNHFLKRTKEGEARVVAHDGVAVAEVRKYALC
jgi:hypothetical protein